MNIILIGFKNSGKTSVAKLTSVKTSKIFIDTDHLIEKHYRSEENRTLSTHAIYKNKGAFYFRNLEKGIIMSLSGIHNSIIATGGGSILDRTNVTILKNQGRLIYLNSSLEPLLKRLRLKQTPAFLSIENTEKNFIDLYKKRKKLYKRYADFEINTDNKSIKDISEEVIFFIDRGL